MPLAQAAAQRCLNEIRKLLGKVRDASALLGGHLILAPVTGQSQLHGL